jgi:hypothetical protein
MAQRTRELLAALVEPGKQLEDALARLVLPGVSARGISADSQILMDRESRKDVASLRHMDDAPIDDLFGRKLRDRFALKFDFPRAGANQPGNRAQRCRFSGTVRTDQCDHFARCHDHVDIAQSGHRAITGADIFKTQHGEAPPVVSVRASRAA